MTDNNSNSESNSTHNVQRDSDAWVSGENPMTGAQASYLKTLSEQAEDPDAFDETVYKPEALRRIDAVKAKLKLD